MGLYKDENGRECSRCGEYKPWFNEEGISNFTYGKRGAACKPCYNLGRKKSFRDKGIGKIKPSPSLPLEVKSRRFCNKGHKDVEENHYYNQRGHLVCRICHFASIVKANRERRRREHPEWRRIDRRKIHRQRLREAKRKSG